LHANPKVASVIETAIPLLIALPILPIVTLLIMNALRMALPRKVSWRDVGRRVYRSFQVELVILAAIALVWITYEFFPKHDPKSLGVPRSLGVIWPALAIGACTLLMRLPTRWVRGAALVFLLGVNLTQGLAHIFADCEPPIDVMVADIHA